MSHSATTVDINRRNFLMGRWRSTSSIDSNCLNNTGVFCQACKDVCDESAIVFNSAQQGLQLPVILTDRCTACMDCVDSCPTKAITIKNVKAS